jgi:2-desacetyl-2-hydroxyethyl bacteriochlorophyllide A dehydrogenase
VKTLVCTSPGHFEYVIKAQPSSEKGHAIIKIKRIGICGTDLHAFEGTQPFFNYPRVLGHELAGEIVEIENNSNFDIGDIVTIMPYFYCNNCIACRNGKTNCCVHLQVAGVHVDGGFAEYYSVPVYALIPGRDLSPDELALIEPLAIGAHGINRADVKPGDNVLIIGAGPIGLGLMEFAKLAGGNVIAMDVNETRLSFCREKLHVQTISSEQELRDITHGEMAPVVIDATGNLIAINKGFSYLSHGGKYVLVGLQKGGVSFSHPEFHKREATLMSSRNATKKDFESVLDAVGSKKINPLDFITHRLKFTEVKDKFSSLLQTHEHVIKAMVDL